MDVVTAILIVLVVVLTVMYFLYRTIQIVPQATAQVVERFGRYHRVLEPGLRFLIPVSDTVRAMVDLREQVVPFPPLEVVTSDRLTVYLDWVVYYQVTDPRRATYEVRNYVQAIEYLVSATLREIVGGVDLERALVGGKRINTKLRAVLDPAAARWGVQIHRVELRAIQPPLEYLEHGTTTTSRISLATGTQEQATKPGEIRPEITFFGSIFAAALTGLGSSALGRVLDGALIITLTVVYLLYRQTNRRRTPAPEATMAVRPGSAAIVTAKVDAAGGLIWIAGHVLPARSHTPDAVYEPGSEVRITAINAGSVVVAQPTTA